LVLVILHDGAQRVGSERLGDQIAEVSISKI